MRPSMVGVVSMYHSGKRMGERMTLRMTPKRMVPRVRMMPPLMDRARSPRMKAIRKMGGIVPRSTVRYRSLRSET